MNKAYRLIWNKAKDCWIIAAEIIKGNGGPSPVTVAAAVVGASLALAVGAAHALPTGGQVAAGQAAISAPSATQMNISQSSNQAIINWNSFGIGKGETVNIAQPSNQSTLLNRVLGNNPSQIFGALNANGQVFLVNPSGILFAPGASVNVGGLVASSLNIKDGDFLAGKYSFFKDVTAGSVVNQGNISGGFIALLGNSVENAGTIVTTKGTTGLAAGDEITLGFDPNGLMAIKVDKGAYAAQVSNSGVIEADGGMVIMSASAADALLTTVVNNSGIVRARGIVERNGKIEIEGNSISNNGTLDASSLTGTGGRITMAGDYITLANGSRLYANGATGGGEVLVGGNKQGSGTMHQATTVTMASNAVIDVSATLSGNGGDVVLWSDVNNPASVTQVQGTILAKGGTQAGNGGQIETSGHQVSINGLSVDTTTLKGNGGLWLIDPYDYTIGATEAGYISGALNGGTSVTIDTINASESVNGNTINGTSSTGNITVTSAISKTAGVDATLTLNADRAINIQAAISSTVGKLNVSATAGKTTNGQFYINGSGSISTNGGDVTAAGKNSQSGCSGVTCRGIEIDGSVNAGGGNINFSNTATNGTTRGIQISNTVQTSGSGTITMNAAANGTSDGISINSAITAQNGDISITGNRGSGSNGINSDGGGSVTTTGTGNINLIASGQVAAGNITITSGGKTYLQSTNLWNIYANNANNDFSGGVRFSGGVVQITDKNALMLGNADGSSVASGALTVVAGGPITQGGALAITGTTDLTAGAANDITLTTATNDFTGGVRVVSGNNVQITDTNGLVLGNANGSSTISGNLTAIANGTITQAGALLVTGTTDLTAGSANNITLTTATNDFTGGVRVVSGKDVKITDVNGLVLGNANGSSTISGDLTVEALGGDLTLSGNVTKSSGSDASAIFKATGSVLFNNGIGITSTTGKLNTILWADSDGSGSGSIFFAGTNAVTTNGGGIWMGGGSGTASWTPYTGAGTLTVGNGYAVGDGITSSGGLRYRGGIEMSSATNLTSGGGNIALYGKSYDASDKSTTGVLSDGGTIDAGSGKILIDGVARGSGSVNSQAVNMAAAVNISSSSSASDAITITGDGSATNASGSSYSIGINTPIGGTIQATGGGGITLNATAGTAAGVWAIQMNSVSILANSGPISLTGNAGSNSDYYFAVAGATIGQKAGTAVTSSSSDITITGDRITTLNGTDVFASSGKLTIEPRTAGTTIGIASGTGTLQLPASYFSTNFANGFSGITIGNATAGDITVGGATTFNDSTTLRSNSTIAINGAVSAQENLVLTSNGAISSNQSVSVTGTTTITAGTANNITLANAANNFTGAVSVVSGSNISIIDSNAMTLGALTSTGTIDIATLTGDLTLTGAVQTTNATASAIKLNADKNAAAGTATGGNIIVSGGTVSVGAGGFATLYSGSVAGSTGLTALVGSGTNRFRYNSDETATNYSTTLVSGLNAIFREQPTATVTANNDIKTYDGLAYSGGNGVVLSGFVNGDSSAVLGGTLVYGGSSQGAINARSYAITPSGYTNGLGYALSYSDGSLTVTPAPLSVTADNASKSYGQTPTLAGTAFTSSGLQNGETIGSVTLASAGTSGIAAVSGSPYSITPSNATGGTFASGNYTITYNNGSLTVTPAPVQTPPVEQIPERMQTPPPVNVPELAPVTPPPLPVIAAQPVQPPATTSSQATDTPGGGGFVSGSFVEAKPMAVTMVEATAFIYPIPQDTFSHSDAKATILLTVRMADGLPLPAWMSYDPVKKVIIGIPPQGMTGEYEIVVIANDQFGGEARTKLKVKVVK